mgnify:CR=1 FL=1
MLESHPKSLINKKNGRIFSEKTHENIVNLNFLAVDNFDFMRKTVKKNLGEKLVKMLGFCQNWIFGQKFDISNSVFVRSELNALDNRIKIYCNEF